jgi:hypothetical protein
MHEYTRYSPANALAHTTSDMTTVATAASSGRAIKNRGNMDPLLGTYNCPF